MEWVVPGSAGIWQSALIGVPIALACGVFSRLLPLRPATRHTLWVAALLGFVLPIVLPSAASLELLVALPDFALPVSNDSVARAIKETSAPSVLDESPDQSIFANDSTLPLDAGHAPETASAFRGDAPAAMEPAHEAEPVSTPRVVLDLGADDPADPDRSNLEADVSVPTLDVRSNDVNPTAIADDRIADIRSPVVTGFITDAPARRSAQRDETSAINLSEIWLAMRSWLLAVGTIIVTALRGMARLPAIPASAWLAGIGLVALVQLIRLWRFRRRLVRALPAPSVVRRMVEDVSREIGLSQ